ncbi:homocysteine S-methyltransferase family protein [Kribbella sp. NPDC051587]|uniref:homocysteine S-methyltransferase family protein n=1 Tax=Kribbella sp. NPDC051587 TaxID=3364119 RepID=UPI0037A5B425
MSGQLPGRPIVTDGGLETDLIFHHGQDLPYFAAFPLLDSAQGRSLLTEYYDGYAAIAEQTGTALMLESATWRASSDWAHLLGYSDEALARTNRDAIAMLDGLRDRYRATVKDVVVGGAVGPRGDGYSPDRQLDADEAAEYHAPQIDAFAQAGADVVTAYTMTGTGEAIGIVRAARASGVPVAISFTLETDGRLPSGESLKDAVTTVDEAGGPDYFLINCAHPTHMSPALAEDGPWRERIAGLRCNASTRSHAELDEATELDEGDLQLLANTHEQLKPSLPNLSIVGGCCGTDARHVAALWGVS